MTTGRSGLMLADDASGAASYDVWMKLITNVPLLTDDDSGAASYL